MNGIGDVRLAKNLGYLQDIIPMAKAIIKATKEHEKVNMRIEDRTMFSKGTIEKYTQKTTDRKNTEEEMEIG